MKMQDKTTTSYSSTPQSQPKRHLQTASESSQTPTAYPNTQHKGTTPGESGCDAAPYKYSQMVHALKMERKTPNVAAESGSKTAITGTKLSESPEKDNPTKSAKLRP